MPDEHSDWESTLPSRSRKPLRKSGRGRGLGPSLKPCKLDHAQHLLAENRRRLTCLLRRFVDDGNWEDASRTFSVLHRFTPRGGHGCTMMDLRKNFLAAIQIQLREGDSINLTVVEQLCSVWTKNLVWDWKCVKERHLVLLELAHFFLTHGWTIEAHEITEYLLKESEIKNDPKLHLIHGMILFEIWYSGLPKEVLLKDSGVPSPLHLEESFNLNVEHKAAEHSNYCNSSMKSELKVSRSCNSYSSIDNYKGAKMERVLPKKETFEDFSSSSLPVNESVQVNREIDELPYSDLRYASIFSCNGIDRKLLPIRLDFISGSIEDKIDYHKELLNEGYSHAVGHLHDALFSKPPLIAALIPYVQILLLGDQVEKVLRELKIFCQLSNSPLSFRLRASLLEVFCKNELIEICSCYEHILRTDPSCYSSLERLISMSKDGYYGLMCLLEMIAMHLDAVSGNSNAWGELAFCLLSVQTARMTEYDRDQMSSNVDHSCYGTSIIFSKEERKTSWEQRCRWWSRHHFSKSKYIQETQTGNLQLLTCKAASASHLYGPTFKYVKDVRKTLKEKGDDGNLMFLRKHLEKPLNLHENLSTRT